MSSTTASAVDETARIENQPENRGGKQPDNPGNAPANVQSLTPRQREVLALIGQGLSTAEIARRLYRTVKTIESHRLMLGKRLGARNRVELARIAIQAGLTDLGEGVEGAAGEAGAQAASSDATCRVLASIEAGTATAHGHRFLEAVVRELGAALRASSVFIQRVGADGTARSVIAWSAEGQAEGIKYTLAHAEDGDLGAGEVRYVEGAPATMLADAHPALRTGVVGSWLAALHDSRGQRLGTLAMLMNESPDEAVCTREILVLLAGRVAAELERKEAEDRFNHLQSLVSSAAERVGLWERDLRTNQVTWSAETYRILGYEPHSMAPTRDRFLSMVHPEDRERVMATATEAASRGSASAIEYRVIRPDGKERRILACYQAAPDATGRAGWLFGTIKDITGD